MKHEKFLFIDIPAGKTAGKIKLENHIEGKITPKSISVIPATAEQAGTVILGYTPSTRKHAYSIVEKTVTNLDKLEATAAKLEGIVCQDIEPASAGKYTAYFLIAKDKTTK